MPNISVIVPVYKVESYLRRCVDSILAQTFQDFELILVDDGSPDNCGAICDEYAVKDSRIRVIHQENGGLSAARNAGIDWAFANSDSQWLSFIDSDDSVSPEYLSRLYSLAINHNADLCICDFQSVLPDGRIEPCNLSIPEMISTGRALLEDCVIYSNWRFVLACCKLYRKTIFEGLRFLNEYIHEDEAIIHRTLGNAQKVCCIPDKLYNYMVRTDSITGSGKSIKSTDYLTALSDRILYAKENHLPNLLDRSVHQYRRYYLFTALPVVLQAESGDCHIKRSANATKSILSALLHSTIFSFREKVRLVLFSLFTRPYLFFSKRRAERRS